MPKKEEEKRKQKFAWPFGGRFHVIEDWLSAGYESFSNTWDLIIRQEKLHPETLNGIGSYSEFQHRPDIHDLAWCKPDVVERFRGASKGFFAVMAPSAGGKDTMLRTIRANHPDLIDIVVTHTTKNPRPEDTPGVTYHFVSMEEFELLKQQSKFAEHVAQFGNSYGTSIDALTQSVQASQPLTIWRGEYVGWNTLRFRLKRIYGENLPFASIFILPEISIMTLTKWIQTKRAGEFWTQRAEKAILEVIAGGTADICIVNPQETGRPIQATQALLNVFKTINNVQASPPNLLNN